MSLYCTLPRGGGSYYHSSIHSPLPPSESESGSGSGSSPSSSSSTITSDSSKQGTISYNYLHSINPRYQHLQSIKTMFNNNSSQQQQQQQRITSSSSSQNEKSTSEDNSLINSNNHPPQSLPQYHHQFQHYQNHHHDYQDYQQQKNGDVSLLSSLVNNSSIESPVTPGLSSPQGNQFNQLLGLSNGLNIYNNINDSNGIGTQGNSIMNPNNQQHQSQYQQQNQQQHQRQSLQLSLPRHPPEPPQRIYYGLTNFDDLKTIRRNSITSPFEDQPTPNFYGDEDSAYDSTSNESLRLTVKELSKRSNSKKYFTLPTKLGRKLRKSSCPEFNKDDTNRQNNQNIPGPTSSTPSPVSDCSPSPKLIFNGPTFPSPSVSSSKAILLTSSSISSSSPTSSIAPSSSSPSSSSPPTSTSSSDVLVSSTVSPPSPSSLVTEMSSSSSLSSSSFPQQLLHNHNVIDNQQSSSSTSTPTNETINSLSPITSSPSANENVCHCCYLLGCHNNQSFHITQCNTAQHQHQQPPGRVNPGVVGINANNISPSSGQPSTLETLWEEPSSGHETVRLTEEAIYAAMRELNISLPTKDSVNGQANRNGGGNSSSWLRANFLKAFRRSSSKNRSSKLISNTNNNSNSNTSSSYSCYPENEKLEHHHDGGSTTPSTIGGSSRRGSLILNSDQNNYPSHHHHQQQQQSSSSCYSDEISSKRTSSGPSVASSLVSLPLSCSSSVPPTPPLTPLPSYHSYQHQQQHQSQLQLQIHDNQQQSSSSSSTLTTSHAGTTTEDAIKELNRQLAEKDQLLQEVCMESINHLNTIESLNELVSQLREEIDLLKNQLNAKYPENGMDKINPDFQYRSNQMQVNQLTNRNCA